MTRMTLEDDIAWIIQLGGVHRDQVIQLEDAPEYDYNRFPHGKSIVHLRRGDAVFGLANLEHVSVHVPSGHVELAMQLAARGYPTMRYDPGSREI